MKKRSLHTFLLLCALMLTLSSCSHRPVWLQTAADVLAERQRAMKTDSLTNLLNADMPHDVRNYLMFLYAYMPMPDVTNYTPDFIRKNVESSLKAQRELSWGNSIPEKEFLHFVLPIRVNNERLDSSRWIFYNELKPRIEKLSMPEAILEVNHWCHEKATYRPSDARTSNPLATVKTAYGRCGEESTFLVAALRSVGIPARQVYTPRWAHSDDNHAWVEAWADGAWHFLGACEPEPVLDLGWFNEPASRAMMMHTKVFGHYDGPEDVIDQNQCFTEINITENYAPTSTVNVTVLNTDGTPADNAVVEFKLYNYAELYSVATKHSDTSGKTSLTSGRGDMVVWASKDGLCAFQKVSFGKDEHITLTLQPAESLPATVDFDLVPPPSGAQLPEVTEQQREENTRRLHAEDDIRKAYEASFPDDDVINRFAADHRLNEAELLRLLPETRGNYATIMQFLQTYADRQTQAFALLNALSQKDLRDVTIEVLNDHMQETLPTVDTELYERYVLSPRVANEHLTPYKQTLREIFKDDAERFRQSPDALVSWCKENVLIDDASNPQRLYMDPLSVWQWRVTDERSLSVFFVAAARSLNIPARINPVDGKLQYWQDTWKTIHWTTAETTSDVAEGLLSIHIDNASNVTRRDVPKYYSQFTLSRVTDARLHLLEYPEDYTAANFSKPAPIEAGQMLLTSGTRLADGSVLARLRFFNVAEDQTVDIPLTLREETDKVQVIGSFNSENIYQDEATGTSKSLLSTTGRGYYVIGIVRPNNEPTNHALRDIAACSKELEAWGRTVVLLCESEEQLRRMNRSEFQGLPSTVVWGADIDHKIYQEIKENLIYGDASMPVFLIADTFNRVVFVRQGYSIGLGEELVKVIRKL